MTPHRLDSIVGLIESRQPACGTTTVVAVDGPSGAGKTSITARLAEATDGRMLHLDDLYPGWHGLAETPAMVASILTAVAVGEVGHAHRWSWVRDRPGPVLHVPPVPLLLIDGVGSGAAIIRPFLSLLLWVEAPTAVRRERALARDGDTYAPFWDVWAEQERHHFATNVTRSHADVVVTT